MDQAMVNMLMSALNVDQQQMQRMLNDANQLANGGQMSQQASQICQMIGRK